VAPLLSVDELRVHFATREGAVRAVDGLSFEVQPGETVAIVGESGCGKSVTSLAILRLLEAPPALFSGRIVFEGRDLLRLDEAEMRHLRGNRISMVFQDPMTSLNPLLPVGQQVVESIMLHQRLSASAAWPRAVEMLAMVGIPAPEQRVKDYPHQLSGGMRQRVMIAIAIACNPKILLADEPTTALDVTIQAQILDLLRDLQARTGSAIVLITHDLGIVAETARRVIVMYAGRKVEDAPVRDLFLRPRHPYTQGLLAAMPRLGRASRRELGAKKRLAEIAGTVPSLILPLRGCAFAGRCAAVRDVCRTVEPALRNLSADHSAACHFAR
jgi:peptide/nickel transport system ATP-binding protein